VPAVAFSRAGARVVESGPAGTGLAADTWARLEALPDPRSPQGRVYPLACLVAVALCALTAAGHDRLSAVGQWVKRASQADLARLRAPWDPIAGRYRAPDEKTIRVVLDRLDPRALSRALLGPRPARTPAAGKGGEGPPAATVRVWRSRRAKAAAMVAARSRLPGVALDGKTSRGARRPDQTRVHLLGVTEHAGRFLDQVEVDVKHNETSHLSDLLAPLDLAGKVVTFDALHTVRSNLDWLVTTKKAHYIAVIKANQPLLHARIKALPWGQIPTAATTRETGHGRNETRTLKTTHVKDLDLPHAQQALKITRWRQNQRTGKTTRENVYAVTDLTTTHATSQDLARLAREHWTVEAGHHVRDVTFTEDHATNRTRHGPINLATIRNTIINTIRDAGYLHIPEGRRDHTTPTEALHLHRLIT
jgi:predicted transposase YbfD/YdcC